MQEDYLTPFHENLTGEPADLMFLKGVAEDATDV